LRWSSCVKLPNVTIAHKLESMECDRDVIFDASVGREIKNL
jgi:hypothetical protein